MRKELLPTTVGSSRCDDTAAMAGSSRCDDLARVQRAKGMGLALPSGAPVCDRLSVPGSMPFGNRIRERAKKTSGAAPIPNPNGVESSSPGLRGTSYPGLTSNTDSTPTGLHPNVASRVQPFQGCEDSSPLPRVARSSQPWTRGWNPFGILRMNFRKALALGCIFHQRPSGIRANLISTSLRQGVGGSGGVETVSTVSTGGRKPFKRFSPRPSRFTAVKRGVNERGFEVFRKSRPHSQTGMFVPPTGLGVRPPSGAGEHPRLPKRQRAGALQDAAALPSPPARSLRFRELRPASPRQLPTDRN